MIEHEDRIAYLDAICNGIWEKKFSELSLEQKHVLDTNLIARYLSGELNNEEYYFLALENADKYGIKV